MGPERLRSSLLRIDRATCLTLPATLVSDMPGGKTDIRWSDSEFGWLVGMADGLGLRPGQVVKRIVQGEIERARKTLEATKALAREIGPAAPVERESSRSAALGTGRVDGDVGVASDGDALGSGGDPGTGPAAAPSVPVRTTGGGERLLREQLAVAREVPCEGGCGATLAWDGLCAVCEAEFAAGRDDCPRLARGGAGRPAGNRADAPGQSDPGSTPGRSIAPGSRVDLRERLATASAESTRRRVAARRPGESAGSGAPVPPAGVAAAPASSPAGAAPIEGVRLLDAVVAALREQGAVVGVELTARKAIRAGKVMVDGEVCSDPERVVDPEALGDG